MSNHHIFIACGVIVYVLGGVLGSFILSKVLHKDTKNRGSILRIAIAWGPLSIGWAAITVIYEKIFNKNIYVHHTINDPS